MSNFSPSYNFSAGHYWLSAYHVIFQMFLYLIHFVTMHLMTKVITLSLISPLKGQFQCAGVSKSAGQSSPFPADQILMWNIWEFNDPQRLAGITNKTEWGLDCWTPGVGFISRRQAISQFPTTWTLCLPIENASLPLTECKCGWDSVKFPRHPRNRKTVQSERT